MTDENKITQLYQYTLKEVTERHQKITEELSKVPKADEQWGDMAARIIVHIEAFTSSVQSLSGSDKIFAMKRFC